MVILAGNPFDWLNEKGNEIERDEMAGLFATTHLFSFSLLLGRPEELSARIIEPLTEI
jgi:hypothetical protein